MRRLPDFLMIGAMKCGTSTLHAQLARQPGFFMSTPKEPNFFGDDDSYARGLDSYGALFAAAPPGALCGESSTDYTKLPNHPDAAARIREQLPHARFVYVMRDPVARLISHYIHEWSEGRIRLDIDRAVAAHPELLAYGCYARQLAPYLDAFPPERVLPVFLERLQADPQAELERVARFLGASGPVRWRAEDERRNVSSQRLRRSPLRAFLDRPLPTTLRRRVVPRAVRERVRRFWQMSRRPELSDGVRASAETVFDPDLELLGGWLDLPLRCRDFAATVLAAPELPVPPVWRRA